MSDPTDTQDPSRANDAKTKPHVKAKPDSGNGKNDDNGNSRKKPLIILAIVVIVLALSAFIWWFMTRNQVSTDDAYTDGDAVTIAPKVAGYVVAMNVDDNKFLHKGDLLIKIDPRDYQAQLDQANAQLAQAQAQLKSAETQLEVARVQYPAQLAQAQAQEQTARANLTQANAAYERQKSVDIRATSQQNIDTVTAQQKSAAANVAQARAQVRTASLVPQQIATVIANVEEKRQQVRQAEAQVETAQLNFGYTEMRAPADGWITKRNVQYGTFLQAGSSIFTLVTTRLWITANFKETQLDRMRPGNKVDIDVDAYPGIKLHGHVDSVQLGSGSRFSAFPAENATGNFVKIVQRVPVKIVIDDGLKPETSLPLGLSVVPTVMLTH
ncbi:Membrane fusion component of tripartite multidrug resistance system [Candidatus Burkholderia pumila]|uniref:Membrane fusion component of tripartite multidrug resistance system n=1 Tax=Candidatus Burkholderia pumila TaxID=1090375 RepID=A0ABR5HND7_9BURK|nr:Membrane fusion component of tripartite multidrug resistance system [Candidatus Burkholderia pumila]